MGDAWDNPESGGEPPQCRSLGAGSSGTPGRRGDTSPSSPIQDFLKDLGADDRQVAVIKIDAGSFRDGTIDCPFGRLVLPIDLWDCKKTQRPCPIQAQVDPPAFEKFRAGCEMPRGFQEQIEQTILSGKYKGTEHHLPGRYLCPLCDSKALNRRYHFLSDLVSVHGAFEVDDIPTAKAFRYAEVDRAIIYTRVCRPCLAKAWTKLRPELVRMGVPVDHADQIVKVALG